MCNDTVLLRLSTEGAGAATQENDPDFSSASTAEAARALCPLNSYRVYCNSNL